ncbi:conserved hypothetical protein [Neospora caninum Liverpool]|uniref:Uncharacterized protein n=1 Tax=Neospora caninum (strain Liverpool) TaxID=572307 RepID=F0VMZ5_NEOCL|nr:conserved hypothetical protein [Neospora caninum Liverpool]CBZ55091.1 conserved hypothetical protein [Neospora caninum Liverpool]|eukprot:XP_003885119.1 conserved hypothetical protein [Neospora caninum Liverpool]
MDLFPQDVLLKTKETSNSSQENRDLLSLASPPSSYHTSSDASDAEGSQGELPFISPCLHSEASGVQKATPGTSPGYRATAPPSPCLRRSLSRASLPSLDLGPRSTDPPAAASLRTASGEATLADKLCSGTRDLLSGVARDGPATESFLTRAHERSASSLVSDLRASCAPACLPAVDDADNTRPCQTLALVSTLDPAPSATELSSFSWPPSPSGDCAGGGGSPSSTAADCERTAAGDPGEEEARESVLQRAPSLPALFFSPETPAERLSPLSDASASISAASSGSKCLASSELASSDPFSLVPCLASDPREATHSTVPSPSAAASAFPVFHPPVGAGDRVPSAPSLASSEGPGEQACLAEASFPAETVESPAVNGDNSVLSAPGNARQRDDTAPRLAPVRCGSSSAHWPFQGGSEKETAEKRGVSSTADVSAQVSGSESDASGAAESRLADPSLQLQSRDQAPGEERPSDVREKENAELASAVLSAPDCATERSDRGTSESVPTQISLFFQSLPGETAVVPSDSPTGCSAISADSGGETQASFYPQTRGAIEAADAQFKLEREAESREREGPDHARDGCKQAEAEAGACGAVLPVFHTDVEHVGASEGDGEEPGEDSRLCCQESGILEEAEDAEVQQGLERRICGEVRSGSRSVSQGELEDETETEEEGPDGESESKAFLSSLFEFPEATECPNLDQRDSEVAGEDGFEGEQVEVETCSRIRPSEEAFALDERGGEKETEDRSGNFEADGGGSGDGWLGAAGKEETQEGQGHSEEQVGVVSTPRGDRRSLQERDTGRGREKEEGEDGLAAAGQGAVVDEPGGSPSAEEEEGSGAEGQGGAREQEAEERKEDIHEEDETVGERGNGEPRDASDARSDEVEGDEEVEVARRALGELATLDENEENEERGETEPGEQCEAHRPVEGGESSGDSSGEPSGESSGESLEREDGEHECATFFLVGSLLEKDVQDLAEVEESPAEERDTHQRSSFGEDREAKLADGAVQAEGTTEAGKAFGQLEAEATALRSPRDDESECVPQESQWLSIRRSSRIFSEPILFSSLLSGAASVVEDSSFPDIAPGTQDSQAKGEEELQKLERERQNPEEERLPVCAPWEGKNAAQSAGELGEPDASCALSETLNKQGENGRLCAPAFRSESREGVEETQDSGEEEPVGPRETPPSPSLSLLGFVSAVGACDLSGLDGPAAASLHPESVTEGDSSCEATAQNIHALSVLSEEPSSLAPISAPSGDILLPPGPSRLPSVSGSSSSPACAFLAPAGAVTSGPEAGGEDTREERTPCEEGDAATAETSGSRSEAGREQEAHRQEDDRGEGRVSGEPQETLDSREAGQPSTSQTADAPEDTRASETPEAPDCLSEGTQEAAGASGNEEGELGTLQTGEEKRVEEEEEGVQEGEQATSQEQEEERGQEGEQETDPDDAQGIRQEGGQETSLEEAQGIREEGGQETGQEGKPEKLPKREHEINQEEEQASLQENEEEREREDGEQEQERGQEEDRGTVDEEESVREGSLGDFEGAKELGDQGRVSDSGAEIRACISDALESLPSVYAFVQTTVADLAHSQVDGKVACEAQDAGEEKDKKEVAGEREVTSEESERGRAGEIEAHSEGETDEQGEEHIDEQSEEEREGQGEEDIDEQSDEGIDEQSEQDIDEQSEDDIDEQSEEDCQEPSEEERAERSEGETDEQSEEEREGQGEEDTDEQGEEDTDEQGEEDIDEQGEEDTDEQGEENIDEQGEEDIDEQGEEERDGEGEEDIGEQSDEERGEQVGESEGGSDGSRASSVFRFPVPDETRPSESRSFAEHFLICTRSPSELSRQSSGSTLRSAAVLFSQTPAFATSQEPSSGYPPSVATSFARLQFSARFADSPPSLPRALPEPAAANSPEREETGETKHGEENEESRSPAEQGLCPGVESPLGSEPKLGREDLPAVSTWPLVHLVPDAFPAASEEPHGESEGQTPVACAEVEGEPHRGEGPTSRFGSPVFGTVLASSSVSVSSVELPLGSEAGPETTPAPSCLHSPGWSASVDDSLVPLASALSPVWGCPSKTDSPVSCFSFSAKRTAGDGQDETAAEQEAEGLDRATPAGGSAPSRVPQAVEPTPCSLSASFSPSLSAGVAPSSSSQASDEAKLGRAPGASSFAVGTSRSLSQTRVVRRVVLSPQAPRAPLESRALSASGAKLVADNPVGLPACASGERSVVKGRPLRSGKTLSGEETDDVDREPADVSRPRVGQREDSFSVGTAILSFSRPAREPSFDSRTRSGSAASLFFLDSGEQERATLPLSARSRQRSAPRASQAAAGYTLSLPSSCASSSSPASPLPDILEERGEQLQESGESPSPSAASRSPSVGRLSDNAKSEATPVGEGAAQSSRSASARGRSGRPSSASKKRNASNKKEGKASSRSKRDGRRRLREREVAPHEARLPSPPDTVLPRKFRPAPIPRRDQPGGKEGELDSSAVVAESLDAQVQQLVLSPTACVPSPRHQETGSPSPCSSSPSVVLSRSVPTPDSGGTECAAVRLPTPAGRSSASSLSLSAESPRKRLKESDFRQTEDSAPPPPRAASSLALEGHPTAHDVGSSSSSSTSSSSHSSASPLSTSSSSFSASYSSQPEHHSDRNPVHVPVQFSDSAVPFHASAVSQSLLPATQSCFGVIEESSALGSQEQPSQASHSSCASRSHSAPSESPTKMFASSPRSNSPEFIVPLTRAEAEEMHLNNPRTGRRPWLCGNTGVGRLSGAGSPRKSAPRKLGETRAPAGKGGVADWCSPCCGQAQGGSPLAHAAYPQYVVSTASQGTVASRYGPGTGVSRPGSPARVYYARPEAARPVRHVNPGAAPQAPRAGSVAPSPAGAGRSPVSPTVRGVSASPRCTGRRYTPGASPRSVGGTPHMHTTARVWRSVTPPRSRSSAPAAGPEGFKTTVYPAYQAGTYVPSCQGMAYAVHGATPADAAGANGAPRPYYVASAQPNVTSVAAAALQPGCGSPSVSKTVIYQSARSPYQGIRSAYTPSGPWCVPPSHPIVSTVPTPSFGPAGVSQAPAVASVPSVATGWPRTFFGSPSDSDLPPSVQISPPAPPVAGLSSSTGQSTSPQAEGGQKQEAALSTPGTAPLEAPRTPAASPLTPGLSAPSPAASTASPAASTASCRRLNSRPLEGAGASGLSGTFCSLAVAPVLPAAAAVSTSPLHRMASVPVSGLSTLPVETRALRKASGDSARPSKQSSCLGRDGHVEAASEVGARRPQPANGLSEPTGKDGRNAPEPLRGNSGGTPEGGEREGSGIGEGNASGDADGPARKGFWYRSVSTNEDCDETQWESRNALSDPGDHMLNTLDKLAKVQDKLDFLQQQVQQQTKELQTYYNSYKTAEEIKDALETSMADCTVCFSRRSAQLGEVEKRLKVLTAESLTGCSTAELEELAQELETTLYKMTAVQTQRAAGVAEYCAEEPPRQLLPFSSDCLPEPKTTFIIPEEPAAMVAVDDCVTLGEEIDTEMEDILKDLRQAQKMHEAFRKEYKRIQMKVEQEVNVFDVDLRKLTSVERTLEERLRRLLCLTGDTDYADVSENALQECFRTVNYAVRRVYRHLALKEAGHPPPCPSGSTGHAESKKSCTQQHSQPRDTRTSSSGAPQRPATQEDSEDPHAQSAFPIVPYSPIGRTSPSLHRGRGRDTGEAPQQRRGPLALRDSSASLEHPPAPTGEQPRLGQASAPWRQGLQNYRLVVTPHSGVSGSAALSAPSSTQQDYGALHPHSFSRGRVSGRLPWRQGQSPDRARRTSRDDYIAGATTPLRTAAAKADAGREASLKAKRLARGEETDEEGFAIEDGQYTSSVSGSDREGREDFQQLRQTGALSSGPFVPSPRDADRQLVPRKTVPYGASIRPSVFHTQEDLAVFREERENARQLRYSLARSREAPSTRGRLESTESVISARSYPGSLAADATHTLAKMPFACPGTGNLLRLSPSLKPGTQRISHGSHITSPPQSVSLSPLSTEPAERGTRAGTADRQQESLEPELEGQARLYQLQEVRERARAPDEKAREEVERIQSTCERDRRDGGREGDGSSSRRRRLLATASAGALPSPPSSLGRGVVAGDDVSRAAQAQLTGRVAKPLEDTVDGERQQIASGGRRRTTVEEGTASRELVRSRQFSSPALPEGTREATAPHEAGEAKPDLSEPRSARGSAVTLERGFSVKLLRDGSIGSEGSVYLPASLVEGASRRGTVESTLSETLPEKEDALLLHQKAAVMLRQGAGRRATTGELDRPTSIVPHNSLRSSDAGDSPGLQLARPGDDPRNASGKRPKRLSAALEALGQSEQLPVLRQLAAKSSSVSEGRPTLAHTGNGESGRNSTDGQDRAIWSPGSTLARVERRVVPSKAVGAGVRRPAIATSSVSALPAPEAGTDERGLNLLVRSDELAVATTRSEEANADTAIATGTEGERAKERRRNNHELAMLGKNAVSAGSRRVTQEQARSGLAAPTHVEYPPSEMNSGDSSGDEMSDTGNASGRSHRVKHRDREDSRATGMDEAERRGRIGSLPDENSNEVFVSAASWVPPEDDGSERSEEM